MRRILGSLPAAAATQLAEAHARETPPEVMRRARRHVVALLFWPFVYWQRPDEYEELIRGEEISARVVAEVDLDDAIVCDIGAGTGRFTLAVARRARHVVAVDAVPALLDRLEHKAGMAGLRNIETRRGSFAALPLADASVDVAVACSAFTRRGPHGGAVAIEEAERIVRPGGQVVIIWPPDQRWLRARGYDYVRVRGEGQVHFRDVAEASRLCERYYSSAAARWVRDHASADVPYRVLRVSPPNDVCIRRIG